MKEFFFFTTTYGPPFDQKLSVVELPNDTVPSAWAPEIAALAGHHFTEKGDYRLLANTVAHQWFGTMVSPATKNDWWLNDGAARYSEALYVEHVAGTAGFQEVTKDMSVGALAYVSVPLADVGKLDTFSPEFQSLVTDKGGMILQMLRWVIGDEAVSIKLCERLTNSVRAGKSANGGRLPLMAERGSGQQLSWFFTQWLNSTGAPEFKNKYTVYRTQKGFRVVGEISQDMDLFRDATSNCGSILMAKLKPSGSKLRARTRLTRLKPSASRAGFRLIPTMTYCRTRPTCKCGRRLCAASKTSSRAI